MGCGVLKHSLEKPLRREYARETASRSVLRFSSDHGRDQHSYTDTQLRVQTTLCATSIT